jgi:hypothetical protein
MAMEKVVIQLDANTSMAVDNLEELRNEIELLNKDVVEGNKDTAQSLKGVEGASKKTALGVRGIGTALKAIGIGFIISALSQLKETFMQNQVVADKFAEVGETASIVFNEFVSIIVDVYESLEKSGTNFKALGTVVTSFLKLAITPLRGSFNAIQKALVTSQLLWEKSFFGGGDEDKIKSLTDELHLLNKETIQIGIEAFQAGKDIVNNFGEAVVSVGTLAGEVVERTSKISIKAANEAAKTNVQLQKQAQLAEVANQGLIEKYDRQAEQLRQIRDDESKSFEDRINANKQLGELLDEQEKAMKANAQARVAAAEAELAKNKTNLELQIAYQDALNEQAAIEAQITGFRSEQQTNTNSLLREQKDLQNELALIGKTEREIERLELQQDYDAKKALIEREITDEEEKNERLLALQEDYNGKLQVLENAKFEMASATLGNIAKAVGENTKAGKAAAAAAALINTYQGITAELATKTVTPFEFAIKLANIATTAAIGFKSVKDILKTTPQSASGAATPPTRGGAAPQPPAFNIVGAGAENQLAETIAGQTQQPVKAYVVSQDVTTAQSLERNIVEGASIGG